MRAQSGNGVSAAEVEAGSSGRRTGAHGRPVLVPPSWESTVRSAPQLFPRGAAAAGAGHAPNRLRVFTGTSNPALSQEVACYLGLELGKMKIKRFADGEIYVQVGRGGGANGCSPLGRGMAGLSPAHACLRAVRLRTGDARACEAAACRAGPGPAAAGQPPASCVAVGTHARPYARRRFLHCRRRRSPPQVGESIRGCDVFLIQPTTPPVNDNMMELLIMVRRCARCAHAVFMLRMLH